MTDYTDQQRAELLEAFAPLRTADVSDGMDWNMLHDLGLVDAAIRPLFRPLRVCGIALTARYVPTDKKIPDLSPEAYDAFSSDWYRNVCTYPFGERIRPGDFVVIDASNLDVGLLGSNNVLAFVNRGAAGIATNGGCRDTDEVIRQACPVFCRHISRTMVQGRLEFAELNVPVDLGGVLVRPGDIVVGDGDGLIVVPAAKALDVAKYARRELENDKRGRRRLYEATGRPLDETVR